VTLTTQKFLYKLFVRYLVVKPEGVNAALETVFEVFFSRLQA